MVVSEREERESSSPTSNACNALLQSTNLQFPCRYLCSRSLLCVLFSNHALQCSVLNISNTVCFILQCSAVKAPIAPPGRAPVENGDTEDTSPSLTMLLPLICCVIGPMLCKSHSVCSRDTCLRFGLTDVSRTSPPPSLPCGGFHTH